MSDQLLDYLIQRGIDPDEARDVVAIERAAGRAAVLGEAELRCLDCNARIEDMECLDCGGRIGAAHPAEAEPPEQDPKP